MKWIHLAQDRNQWWDLVNTERNLQVTSIAGSFLTSWATISFSRWTLLHGFSTKSDGEYQRFVGRYYFPEIYPEEGIMLLRHMITTYQVTRCHNQEYQNMNLNRGENLETGPGLSLWCRRKALASIIWLLWISPYRRTVWQPLASCSKSESLSMCTGP
jgi:hypothetical protein